MQREMSYPKKRRPAVFVTEQLLARIHDYASRGVTDREIAEQEDMSIITVSKMTTQYWKDKMKNKKNIANEI